LEGGSTIKRENCVNIRTKKSLKNGLKFCQK
jgi:hypothetical protein